MSNSISLNQLDSARVAAAATQTVLNHWEDVARNEYRAAPGILSVGCTFAKGEVNVKARYLQGAEEFTVDAAPWRPFMEPTFEYYPIFRWIAYTVAVGQEVQIRYHLSPGMGGHIHRLLDEYFWHHRLECGVLSLTRSPNSIKDSKSATDTVRDGFIHRPDGNSLPLTRWAQKLWDFLEANKKEYAVQMLYDRGALVLRAGYDSELLPIEAKEIIDYYRG